MPAPCIQFAQRLLGDISMVYPRGDQHLMVDACFTQWDLIGKRPGRQTDHHHHAGQREPDFRTIVCGSRWRARQYAPVRTLPTACPQATRRAAQPLTAFWHELSDCSACCMNIDNVTIGGYNRSRYWGIKCSVVSINSALVSTLKNSNAWTEPVRRWILPARCSLPLRALRPIKGPALDSGVDA